MSNPQLDLDALLDDAVEQIARTEPTTEQADAAAGRVWQRLSADDAGAAVAAAELRSIEGCDDYQALIPAYLTNSLPQARRLLFEEHTRECVPCRRALKAGREGRPLEAPRAAAPQRPARRTYSFARWAIAAALVAAIGVSQYLIREVMPFGSHQSATIHSAEGELFRVASTAHMPMQVNDSLMEGQSVRTSRDGGAVLRLEDGSLVELSARSQISIDENRRGTTIQLERGNVIVQAAKQRDRHLYVSTDDCLVSVTGTIFSVNHGTKGSRVSVIEGEVKVNYSDHEEVLTPGEQVATQKHLGFIPLDEEIAWSQDLDTYLEMLAELDTLRQEIRSTVNYPELRYDSRLLDLVAEDTVFYGAFPNLGSTVSETHRVVQEHLAENPALAEWWQTDAGNELEPMIEDLIGRFTEVAEYLGEELVVSGSMPEEDFKGPLLLAEVVDAAALRDFIERQIEEANGQSGHDIEEGLVWVDDPRNPPQSEEDHLFVWLDGEIMVASLDAARMATVASIYLDGAANPFTETDFYQDIAELYEHGAEIVVAVDLDDVVEHVTTESDMDADGVQAFSSLGFDRVRHLLVEQKRVETKTHYGVSLSFAGERRGMASWLAAPAPMGSLDFVSPEAKLVASVVFEDPVKMFDDLQGVVGSDGNGFGEFIQLFRSEHGIDLRDDFFGALGGELTFALDGPLLPTPAWKVILEVYDPARLQFAIEQGVAEANQHLAEEGGENIALSSQGSGGRTVYSMGAKGMEFHYTFVEGYMIVAPSRALVDRGVRFHDSGYSIVDSPRFNRLMPDDGRNNFSALIYQDLSSLLQAAAERLAEGQMAADQQELLDRLKANRQPTLGFAYGDADRITLAASSEGDVLSALVMRMLGVKDPASLEQLLGGAMEGVVF